MGDNEGHTALFYAARHAKEAQPIEKLLAAGADPNRADNDGQTPLFWAAEFNPNDSITLVLVKGGANPNMADKQGQTPLMLAAAHNQKAVLDILLRAKADPSAKDQAGKTAADYLAQNEEFTEQERTDYRQAMLVLHLLRPLE